MTVSVLMPKTRAVSRMPLPLRAMSIIRSLDLGQTSFIGRIEQKRLVQTVRILAAIALLVRIRFTAFSDVVTLTIGTRHSNENHSFSLQIRPSA